MASQRAKKIIILLFIGMMTLITAICVTMQYRSLHSPQNIRISRYSKLSKTKYEFNIETIKQYNAAYDEISGWVALPKVATSAYTTQLVLYRESGDHGLVFSTKMVNRTDVTSHIGDGIDHSASGFDLMLPKKYVNAHYRIAFLMKVGNDERLLVTNKQFNIKNRGND